MVENSIWCRTSRLANFHLECQNFGKKYFFRFQTFIDTSIYWVIDKHRKCRIYYFHSLVGISLINSGDKNLGMTSSTFLSLTLLCEEYFLIAHSTWDGVRSPLWYASIYIQQWLYSFRIVGNETESRASGTMLSNFLHLEAIYHMCTYSWNFEGSRLTLAEANVDKKWIRKGWIACRVWWWWMACMNEHPSKIGQQFRI